MEISVRSETTVYIDIGDWTYYIDDSTGEQILKKWMWKNREEESDD